MVQQTEEGDGLCSTTRSKISLVDLAGSERVGKTSASGQTLKEAQSINQSLSALGNCMRALTQPASIPKKKSLQRSVLSKGRQISSSQVRHIPYRDSKLTHLLKSSLGGNAKTTLIIAVASDMENLEETVSTLRFGIRAKTHQKQCHCEQINDPPRAAHEDAGFKRPDRNAFKRKQQPQAGACYQGEITGKQGNSIESIRYLKQSLREKDSMLAAEKLKTTSLAHALEETKDKLALNQKELARYETVWGRAARSAQSGRRTAASTNVHCL